MFEIFFDLLSLLISCLWCATLLCRCSARRNTIVRFLDTNSLILIGFWCVLQWYFLRFSRWENSKSNVFLVYTHMRTPPHSPFCVPQRGKVVIFGSVRTKTNILPGCCVSCGCFFQRTSFNCVLTLVHPLVLQLREYPLNPVTFNLCYVYLRTISTLFFSSQFLSPSMLFCFRRLLLYIRSLPTWCASVWRGLEQAKDKGILPTSKYDLVRLAPSARRLAMLSMHTVSPKRWSCEQYCVFLWILVFLVSSMICFNVLGSTGWV